MYNWNSATLAHDKYPTPIVNSFRPYTKYPELAKKIEVGLPLNPPNTYLKPKS